MKQTLEVLVEEPAAKSSPAPLPAAAHGSRRMERLRTALHSVHLQSALQIAAGMFVACLFTFVSPLRFTQSCIAATLFLVVSVMSSPNNHLGTRINAAASLVGSMWPGAVAAAVVASISKLPGPGPASTAMLCVLGCAAIALLAVNRVCPHPPMLWALGMNSCLAFGMVAITTWRFSNVAEVWLIAGSIMLVAVIAACVASLVAALVAPSLASEQVQDIISDVLRDSGTATSRYAARLFRPRGDCGCTSSAVNATSKPLSPAGAKAGSTAATAAAPQGGGKANPTTGAVTNDTTAAAAVAASAFTAVASVPCDEPAGVTSDGQGSADPASSGFWYSSSPEGFGLDRSESVYNLGEVGAALVMDESLSEEQWLLLMQANSSPNPPPNPRAYRCPMPQAHVGVLRPRLAEALALLPAAAVEPQWLRGFGVCGSQHWFAVEAWDKVIKVLQLLLTRLSALEAVIEDGETLHESSSHTFSPGLLSRLRLVYSQTATSLALMSHSVRVYGGRPPPGQTWSNSCFDCLDRSSKAQEGGTGGTGGTCGAGDTIGSGVVVSGPFCGMVAAFGRSWAEAKADLAACMQEEQQKHWQAVVGAAPGSGGTVVMPTLTKVRHLMFSWSLTNGLIDTLQQLEAAAAAALCRPPPPSTARRLSGWLPPLLPLLAGVHLMRNWVAVLCRGLPAALKKGSAGLSQLSSSRVFQAGFKYWLVLCLVFCATIVSLHHEAALVALNPVFGYVAASLAMSERVEATVSKVSFWIAGTIAGGLLGFVSMLHPATATNPYALMAIMVGAALAVGLLGQTRARVSITLTLMTLSALVLCQCCGHAGQAAVAAARVVSVISGVLTSAVVCNVILPWYTSDWAIQVMSDVYERAVQLTMQLYALSYEEGAAAVAAFEVQCPAPAAGLSSSSSSTAERSAATAAGSGGVASAARGCITYTPAETKAATNAAKALAAFAADAFPADSADSAASSSSGGVDVASAAVLHALISKPLIDVQVSLMKDTVAWKRGVLATPPIVPRLLSVLLALLDRLAALQLAMNPPSITGRFTGVHHLVYGVPLTDKLGRLFELLGLLVSAVAAALQSPTRRHLHAVKVIVKCIEAQRVAMYRQMHETRSAMHAQIIAQLQVVQGDFNQAVVEVCAQLTKQQQQQGLRGQQQGTTQQQMEDSFAASKRALLLLGGVDDAVRFLGFQFAVIKVCDKAVAVARVAMEESCQARNNGLSTLR